MSVFGSRFTQRNRIRPIDVMGGLGKVAPRQALKRMEIR